MSILNNYLAAYLVMNSADPEWFAGGSCWLICNLHRTWASYGPLQLSFRAGAPARQLYRSRPCKTTGHHSQRNATRCREKNSQLSCSSSVWRVASCSTAQDRRFVVAATQVRTRTGKGHRKGGSRPGGSKHMIAGDLPSP